MASPAYSTPPESLTFQFPTPETSTMFTDFAGMDYERTRPQLSGHQVQHAPHVTPVYVSNGFGTQNGVGSFGGFGAPNGLTTQIERLNNVQERITERITAPQPKRRKTQSEYDPGSSFSTLGPGMFTSVTGQQQHPVTRPNLTPRPAETVDLTANDVDEGNGVPKEQPRDEEVCYGMVEGATILCTSVPAPKPGMVAIGGDGYWPQIKVLLRRKLGDSPGHIPVWDIKRQVFGTLDRKTAECLSGLLDSTLHIRTDALIPTRRKDPTEVVGQPIEARANRVALMLYGPRKFANSVGNHLVKHHIKLVSPLRVEPGVKIFNPMPSENRPQLTMRTPNTGDSRPPQYASNRSAEEVRNEVIGVFDSLQKADDLPEMEACDLITTPLMKHQRQGLYFMTSREADVNDASELAVRTTWRCKKDGFGTTIYHNLVTDERQHEFPPVARGGILADMMGLGKTLSILSLITNTLGDASAWARLPPTQPQVPERKTHQHPSQSFHPPRPPPFALMPLVLNSKATLLVCPLSTVSNWEEQIKHHIKPLGLRYYIYHGQNRIKDPKILATYDLVMTTYGSVSSELNSRAIKRRDGHFPLEQIGWFRIVLDEAHMIREQNTLAFKAICRLQASRRWAVTGTPVQNKLEDLASLLSFVRVKPFDEKSKFVQHIITPFKNANPEIVPKLRTLIDTITLRRLKDRIDLPKRTDLIIRLDFDEKEQQVYDWFANNTRERIRILTGQGGQERIAGKAMIHILRSILQLRLICAHGKDLLNADGLAELQGMTADTPIDLSDDEDEKPVLHESKAYDFLYLMQQSSADICAKCSNRLGAGEVIDLDADKDNEGQDDLLGYMSPASCVHVYCPSCIKTLHRQSENQRCDDCCSTEQSAFVELSRSRAALEQESKTSRAPAPKNARSEPDDDYVPHTKTRALVDDLLENKKLSMANPTEPPYKSVVFSGWTSHLDLIERALDNVGITHTRLDGKMTRTARTAAMDAFRDDPSVQVILVSITAGGLGLNLTTGNSVYVMEPQFNPAAEAQAVDRVHRLGQKREVKTVRYIMRHSFEERMLNLQDKKTKLANLSLDDRDKTRVMDRAEATKQRLMDLRSLFR